MHRRLARPLALLALAALLATACGSDRDNDDDATDETTSSTATDGTEPATSAPGDTSDTTADDTPDVPTFGDAAWPCGPGDASGATAQGVTDDEIRIGTGDDRGFAGSPGLNKEATDAVLAMIDVCNELGGIGGRQIVAENYDAALFNVGGAMAEACQEVFMLVGQSWAVDDQGEELRVGCDLAAVPGFSVSAAFAHGPRMRQALPNPADEINMGIAEYLVDQFPERAARAAAAFGNFPATIETKDKTVSGVPEGMSFVLELEYNVGGEEDWTPFALQMKDNDIGMIHFGGTCDNLQAMSQAAINNDADVVWMSESNMYSELCADLNSDGSLDDVYLRSAYVPFEEAEFNPATQDFVDIMADAGVTPSLLGEQATASFLLWATGAAACGSELTADCVLTEIDEIDEWTGHGLHAPSVPRTNRSTACTSVLKFEGSSYVRVWPEEPATFECDPSFVVEVDTPALQAAQLNEDRISTLYAG